MLDIGKIRIIASVLCLHAVAWRCSAYQDVIVLAVEQQQCLTSDALTTEYRRQDSILCTCAAEQSFLDDGQIGQGFALICVSFSSFTGFTNCTNTNVQTTQTRYI